MNVSNNRRIKITKKIFQETLIELLQTKQISEISVKQLCEKADMNRSTFYMHYANTMDLLEEIETETYEKLASYIFKKRDAKAKKEILILKDILEFAKANSSTFRMLLGQEHSKKFQKDMLSFSTKYSILEAQIPQKNRHYIELYHSSGCIATIKEWLDNGTPESTEEMSQLIISLLYDHSPLSTPLK